MKRAVMIRLSVDLKNIWSCSLRSGFLMIVGALALAAQWPAGAQEPPRYQIDASFDDQAKTIQARQKVTFTNNSGTPLSELCFHIYPHRAYTQKEIRFMYRYAGYFKVNPYPEGFQSGDLNVTAASTAGRPLTYTIEGTDNTILKVALEAPLAPEASIEVDLEYTVRIPHAYGKFGWHRGIVTLARWYPILSVADKEGWHNYPFYIYHQPYFSDAAYYRVSLTLAQGYTVAASAALTAETKNNDGTQTLVYETEAPVRDFAFGASKDFRVYSLETGHATIRAYYLEGGAAQAEAAARDAGQLMDFYAQRFGAYPYKEFNIVPSYLAYGGCQSSSLVFIDTRVFKLPGFLRRYFDFLIAHETGHQWFYNIIGSDEYRQMFLDEGMNSYWLLQYLEQKYGAEAMVMELPRSVRWLIPNFSFRESTIARYLFLAKNGLDRPVISDLSSFQEPSSIFALTYGKGAAVIQMLKSRIGADAFDRVMKRYAEGFRFRNVSLDDLIALCEEESQEKLGPFFEDWLKTNKTCDYAVRSVGSGAITLENKGSLSMPVDTLILFTDGTMDVQHWDGRGVSKTIPLDPAKKIQRVELDPSQAIVIDLDRTNNHWPRKQAVKPVPLYHFGYEIPVVLPRDSYNTVVGPSVGSSLGLAGSFQKPYDSTVKFSTGYDVSDGAVESTVGYEIAHVGNKQQAVGFEVFNYESSEEKEDRTGGRVYFRKELWPASYGLLDGNDHVTFYLTRDQRMDRSTNLSGGENTGDFIYRRRDETVFGITGSLGRYGPYGDPLYGWKFTPTQEVAGHLLGGNDAFWRSSVELDNYRLLIPRAQHTLASRVKIGAGGPSDKNLFQLGGANNLRGYSSKAIEGANMLLGSLEYRMPVFSDMGHYFADNMFCFDKVQLVGFIDVGKAWQSDFEDTDFKKDVGIGLRCHFDIVGFLEKALVRLDVAQAINEPKEDLHVWLGLSHTF